jgi:hypothetical protein
MFHFVWRMGIESAFRNLPRQISGGAFFDFDNREEVKSNFDVEQPEQDRDWFFSAVLDGCQ